MKGFYAFATTVVAGRPNTVKRGEFELPFRPEYPKEVVVAVQEFYPNKSDAKATHKGLIAVATTVPRQAVQEFYPNKSDAKATHKGLIAVATTVPRQAADSVREPAGRIPARLRHAAQGQAAAGAEGRRHRQDAHDVDERQGAVLELHPGSVQHRSGEDRSAGVRDVLLPWHGGQAAGTDSCGIRRACHEGGQRLPLAVAAYTIEGLSWVDGRHIVKATLGTSNKFNPNNAAVQIGRKRDLVIRTVTGVLHVSYDLRVLPEPKSALRVWTAEELADYVCTHFSVHTSFALFVVPTIVFAIMVTGLASKGLF